MKRLCITFALVLSFVILAAASHVRPEVHDIPLPFTGHAQPCFMSEVLGSFAPTQVAVINRRADDWGLIRTADGPMWVYLPANRRYLAQETYVYEYPGQRQATASIPPQLAMISAARGDWLQIVTWMGLRWINTGEPTPCVQALDDFFRTRGLGVFYMDIESGFTYMFNPDRQFFCASINKIQHALFLYDMAERGLLDLTEIHTYRPGDYSGGTGVIRHMPFGREFTRQELLTKSIRYSDNVAFRILLRLFPADDYREFARSIGANTELIHNITGANITARDMGVWMLAVYDYINSGGRYSAHLRQDMLTTNVQAITSQHPVLNKYGWATNAFHDAGIVLACRPFIIVLLSTMDSGAFNSFAAASRRIYEFHTDSFQR